MIDKQSLDNIISNKFNQNAINGKHILKGNVIITYWQRTN